MSVQAATSTASSTQAVSSAAGDHSVKRKYTKGELLSFRNVPIDPSIKAAVQINAQALNIFSGNSSSAYISGNAETAENSKMK